MSKIEWTGKTWNPVTGCTIVSDGCKNCYAMRGAHRINNFKTTDKYVGTVRISGGRPKWTGVINVWPDLFDWPKSLKKPETIFVNSMSDLFHESIPKVAIAKIFKTMNDTPRHTYQILTKRPALVEQKTEGLEWSENIWLGVSVENYANILRIFHLRRIPAHIRFVSFEPLIGRIPAKNLSLKGIDWAIVGGESGPGCRPMDKEWVKQIHAACDRDGTIFNFKQWGGANKKRAGRIYNGRIWDGMPKTNFQQPELFETL